jgi:hypothetical protein
VSVGDDIAALTKALTSSSSSAAAAASKAKGKEVVRGMPAQIITGASKAVDARYNALDKHKTVVRAQPTTGTITGSSKAVVPGGGGGGGGGSSAKSKSVLNKDEVMRGQPTTGIITGSSTAVDPASDTTGGARALPLPLAKVELPRPSPAKQTFTTPDTGTTTIHLHIDQPTTPAQPVAQPAANIEVCCVYPILRLPRIEVCCVYPACYGYPGRLMCFVLPLRS